MGGWIGRKAGGRLGSLATLVVLAVTASASFATLASAAPSTKYYTLAVLPSSVAEGSTRTFQITLGNSSESTQTLGSANVEVPAGLFSSISSVPGTLTASAGQQWTACLGDGNTCGASPNDELMLRAVGSHDALNPGDTVTATMTGTVGCGTGMYTWTSMAKQSNDFNGTPGNAFTLTSGGDPTVSVGAGGGAPSYFGVSVPSSVTAGTAFDATVTAYDSCNNPTPYMGTGTLTGNLGTAPNGETPSYGSVVFSGGSSTTASVTAYKAETGRRLTVSMGVPYSDATSNTFTVVPAPPASAVFTTQPNVLGSQEWQLTTSSGSLTQFNTAVTLYDTYGNLATNAGGDVSLSLNPPPGFAGGTLGGTSSEAAASGVATFGGLTVSTSGVGYTLTATYGGGSPTGTSDPFSVYDSYTQCTNPNDCLSGTLTTGSGMSQSQGQAEGQGGFFSLGLGGVSLDSIPAGCQSFQPLNGSDVPLVVIDQRTTVGGTLTVVDGANLKAIKKKFSTNNGQQFIPICVGAMRIALNQETGKTYGVPCDGPYPGPNGPIPQATAANLSATGWWGKTLDSSGNFVPYSVSQAVCDPTTGYFFGIVGSFQDYTAPSGDSTIDPANNPTVTGWGTDPTGTYRDFTIVYPASSDTQASGTSGFAGIPWDGFQFH